MKRLRFLLLQARNQGDPCLREELESFAQRLGVEADRIRCHDMLEQPPSLQLIRGHDALLMGGSGEYYVSHRNLPQFEGLMEVLAEATRGGHPTFASCFGFHCLVEALDGRIHHDPPTSQVGTYELELTDEAAADPLLGDLPRRFMGQMGRKDRAVEMPPGTVNLVTSSDCPFLAFRVPGQPAWAFQFHPELDEHTNRGRLTRYREIYLKQMSLQEFERILQDRFCPTPDTEALPRRFLELVFG